MAKKGSSDVGLQRYKFSLEGLQPLFMHADCVESADTLEVWRKAPENKRRSKRGDDRTPPWTWLTYLYTDGEHVVIPRENLLAMLIKGGSSFKVGRMATLKAEAAASVFFDSDHPILLGKDKQPLLVSTLEPLRHDDGTPFAVHVKAAKALGFALDVRRATVGTSKWVRVRPRFDRWAIEGEFSAYDDGALGSETLQQLFSLCGRRVGLCDWRPSSPKKPGPWGTFTAIVTPV